MSAVAALAGAALGCNAGDGELTDAGQTSPAPSTTSTGSASSKTPPSATEAGVSNTPPPGSYTVSGPFVLDANGNKHVFRGVDRPSLEWSSMGDNLAQSDYDTMKAWGANAVRIPLNQDFWIVDPTNPSYIPAYPDTVDQQVQWAEADGLDVILDLHWSDAGSFSNSAGQWCMADQNSVTFWTQVATKYKGDPHVLFELYNEPYVVSASAPNWNIWLKGGMTTCSSHQSAGGQSMTFTATFMVAGMQQLYNTVRATGAENLVVVGGLNYAFDLSQVGEGMRVLDANGQPAHNLLYNTHPYNESGKMQPDQWYQAFGYLAATDPVIATEFGDGTSTSPSMCAVTYDTDIMAYFDTKGASNNPVNPISWTAWAFYAGGCSFPSLLQNGPGATGWEPGQGAYVPNAPGMAVEAELQSFQQP